MYSGTENENQDGEKMISVLFMARIDKCGTNDLHRMLWRWAAWNMSGTLLCRGYVSGRGVGVMFQDAVPGDLVSGHSSWVMPPGTVSGSCR